MWPVRGLVIGAVLLVLGFPALSASQVGELAPVERVIDRNFEVRSIVSECTVPNAAAGLARVYRFAAGIEYPRAKCARMGSQQSGSGELVDLRGMTVGGALTKLVEMDPRYRWVDSDGVIVLRPLAAWSDPTNTLNFETDRFVLEDATIGTALLSFVSSVTGEKKSEFPFSERTEQAARRFNVTTRTTSAGEALDAIVRAHGASYWIARESDFDGGRRHGRMIFLKTFDDAGISVAVRDPK